MHSAEIIAWLRDGQRLFNDSVVSQLETIRQEHALAAYAGLTLVGFLYGIVHAVGPGHGKMIVSSYVLANENSLKRGLLIVALSSLLQALVAIALVLGFYHLLAATRAEAEQAAVWLETGSFALIGLLGIWLMTQGIAVLSQLPWRSVKKHYHNHKENCGCGHAHLPTAQQLTGKKDALSMVAMIVSVGIRPCSGALLLLFFSCRFELVWPGVLATFAMAAGTAATTGALAILAVKSKHLALSLVKKSDRALALAHAGLRLGGGAVILLAAGLFLAAQWSGAALPARTQHPLYKTLQ